MAAQNNNGHRGKNGQQEKSQFSSGNTLRLYDWNESLSKTRRDGRASMQTTLVQCNEGSHRSKNGVESVGCTEEEENITLDICKD